MEMGLFIQFYRAISNILIASKQTSMTKVLKIGKRVIAWLGTERMRNSNQSLTDGQQHGRQSYRVK